MFYVKDSAFFYKAHIVSATSSVSCDFFSCQISFILKNVFYIEILIRCIIKVFGTCCQKDRVLFKLWRWSRLLFIFHIIIVVFMEEFCWLTNLFYATQNHRKEKNRDESFLPPWFYMTVCLLGSLCAGQTGLLQSLLSVTYLMMSCQHYYSSFV